MHQDLNVCQQWILSRGNFSVRTEGTVKKAFTCVQCTWGQSIQMWKEQTCSLQLLRSAVGMTHDLRSDLWWTIPLRILLVRLHSEIDHIHLSSEAQCVSHLYPQVDCHNSYLTRYPYGHKGSDRLSMLPLPDSNILLKWDVGQDRNWQTIIKC